MSVRFSSRAISELAIEAMPSFLLPRKGRYGLRDYEKMFCPDLKSGHDIFTMRGIDRERGCMVIVRPDQYVAHVLPLDGYAQLAAFFDGFMMRHAERCSAGHAARRRSGAAGSNRSCIYATVVVMHSGSRCARPE